MGGKKLFDNKRFALVIDHAPSSPTPVVANTHKLVRQFAREQGCIPYEAGEGIVRNVTREAEIRVAPLPPVMLELLNDGAPSAHFKKHGTFHLQSIQGQR